MDRSSLHILVVDDDTRVLNVLAAALQREGFTVLSASSAAAAREHGLQHKLHLVVMDLTLPDDTGLHLAAELNQQEVPPAIIIITGDPSIATAAEGMQLGARNYLTKPVAPSDLVRAVESVLSADGLLIEKEEEILSEMGRRLRSTRQAAELTMKNLGDRVGISQAQISQIESGVSAPSLLTLFRLCRVLKIKLSSLFEGL